MIWFDQTLAIVVPILTVIITDNICYALIHLNVEVMARLRYVIPTISKIPHFSNLTSFIN